MRTTIQFLLLCVMAIGMLCCSSDDDVHDSDLLGTWNWESTGGGEAYHIFETPVTQNSNIQIHILSDDTFTFIENDSEIASGTYEIKYKLSNLTEENERFIRVVINSEKLNDFIIYEGIIHTYNNGNTMIIRQDFEKGITSVFKRM